VVDFGSTPRMPDTEADDRRMFWYAISYAALSQFGGERIGYWAAPLAFSFIYVPYLGLAAVRYVRAMWQVRRYVRLVRTLDSPGRQSVLEDIEDLDAREQLSNALDEHGEPTSEGLVSTFSFSPIDKRQWEILFWSSCVVTVLGGLGLFRGAVPSAYWGAGTGLAALVAFVAAFRRRQLARTFDISPFGLSEVTERGAVRRLLFAQPLTLSNHPWRRRLELRATGQSECIALSYDLVGLVEAVNLIKRHGGFEDGAT